MRELRAVAMDFQLSSLEYLRFRSSGAIFKRSGLLLDP